MTVHRVNRVKHQKATWTQGVIEVDGLIQIVKWNYDGKKYSFFFTLKIHDLSDCGEVKNTLFKDGVRNKNSS